MTAVFDQNGSKAARNVQAHTGIYLQKTSKYIFLAQNG